MTAWCHHKYVDVNNLVQLVADDLKENTDKRFGSRNVHQHLSLSQLEELQELVPSIIDNESEISSLGESTSELL